MALTSMIDEYATENLMNGLDGVNAIIVLPDQDVKVSVWTTEQCGNGLKKHIEERAYFDIS